MSIVGIDVNLCIALSAFCLGNGDLCRMTTPELHDNIENKSFIATYTLEADMKVY